jgi:pseudoazurin
MRSKLLWSAVLLGVVGSANVMAEEHVVKAVITNWEPMVLYAKPGDTIRFVQMAGHNTASIDGMLPAGAAKWESKMGDEGYTLKVEKEGAYIYKCTPHMTTGMVAAIVVGDGAPSNLAALDTALNDVPLGKNMVARVIKKMKADLQAKGRIQ